VEHGDVTIEIPNILLVEYIGGGAFGWVYAGKVLSTGLIVAIKIIRTDYAEENGRAAREALMASRLSSGCILRVFDIKKTESYWVIIMELVRGHSFERCPISLALRQEHLRNLGAAILHMAERGVVHRDLKPANIVLRDRKESPVIVDFGLAISLPTYDPTREGSFAGTPYFLPPEAFRGEPPSPAFDAYALGVTFSHLLLDRKYLSLANDSALTAAKLDGTFARMLCDPIDGKKSLPFTRHVLGLVNSDPDHRLAILEALVTAVDHTTQDAAGPTIA
jgi:serine/threonine protein kinase